MNEYRGYVVYLNNKPQCFFFGIDENSRKTSEAICIAAKKQGKTEVKIIEVEIKE